MIILLTIWRIALLVRQVENERRITEFVLDSTGDGIIGLDRDGLVAFANLSARRMLRCREEDLVGQRFPRQSSPPRRRHAVRLGGLPRRRPRHERGSGHDPGPDLLPARRQRLPVEIVVSPLMRDGVLTGSVTSFRGGVWSASHRRGAEAVRLRCQP